MFFLWLILILFIIEAARIYQRIQKAKKAARMTIYGDPVEIKKNIDRLNNKKEGGITIKHFNGKYDW